MGMSASQAQLLSITSRMSDNELRAQIISNDKQRLATESSQVSGHYVETLQATNMQFASYDKSNNQISEKLTFNNLTRFNKLNAQYGISNLAGQLYVSEKDADMFQRAIAARDPLTSFLNEQGFFYETSYFDNLDKYLVNGKVSYRGQDYHGAMTQLSTGCNIDEIKTMYFGESPTAAVNGIYHKGFEKITPDMVMYMDLVNRVEETYANFAKAMEPHLMGYTLNNLTRTGPIGGSQTNGPLMQILNNLGGTLGSNGRIQWAPNCNADVNYKDQINLFTSVLEATMTSGILKNGYSNLDATGSGTYNDYYANFSKEAKKLLQPFSVNGSDPVPLPGVELPDPEDEDAEPVALYNFYNYNPYSTGVNAFTVSPFRMYVNVEDPADIKWYYCYLENDNIVETEIVPGETETFKHSYSTKNLSEAQLRALVATEDSVVEAQDVLDIAIGNRDRYNENKNIYTQEVNNILDVINQKEPDDAADYENDHTDRITSVHDYIKDYLQGLQTTYLALPEGSDSYNNGETRYLAAAKYASMIFTNITLYGADDDNGTEGAVSSFGTLNVNAAEFTTRFTDDDGNNSINVPDYAKLISRANSMKNTLLSDTSNPYNSAVAAAQASYNTAVTNALPTVRDKEDDIEFNVDKDSIIIGADGSLKFNNNVVAGSVRPYISYGINSTYRPFPEIEYTNYQKVTSWSRSTGRNKYYYEVTEGGERVAYGENQNSNFVLTNNRKKDWARRGSGQGPLVGLEWLIPNKKDIGGYNSVPHFNEDGTVTFEEPGSIPSDNFQRFEVFQALVADFFENCLDQYNIGEMLNRNLITVDSDHPAYDEFVAYEKAGKQLADFLCGDGYSDRADANKNYIGMCNPDELKDMFNEEPAATNPFQTQTVRNVIDGGTLERIFDTYGEPKQCWVDANGNDCTQEARWYTNLFNRMKEGYKALEDGLAADPKWIDYALKSGLAVMEQVDGTNAWSSMIYTNCADITESKDSTSVAIAEAEYNREMSKIQAKDKRCDMELKQIDTEHNSLQVEYDSIKAALDKNMERTLKIYSA